MAFWSVELEGDKPVPFVPPPEASRLHLSQATLTPDAPAGGKVAVKCKVDDSETYICSLREGGQESTSLDLAFDSYTEFSLAGGKGAKVHLAGYIVPDEEDVDEDSEDDELPMSIDDLSEEDLLAFVQQQKLHQLSRRGEADESEEEEEEEEDTDEDEDEDGEEDEEGEKVKTPLRSVIIEDITDLGQPETRVGKNTASKSEVKPKAVAVKVEGTGPGEIQDAAAEIAAAAAADLADATAADIALDSDKDEEEKASDVGMEMGEDESDEVEDEDEDEDDEEDEVDEEEKGAHGVPMEKKGKAGKKKQELAATKAEPEAVADKKKKAEASPKVTAQKKRKRQGMAVEEAPVANGAAAAGADGQLGKKGVKKFANGFTIETVALGSPSGKLAKPGKKVAVKYVGRLAKTGKVFDGTKGNKTFSFRLGVGEVIKGWDQGVVGMRVGDKRKLSIPPQMGYGSSGVKNVIPGNATLNFEVELVDVK